jgi:hypothetical protein
MLIKADDEETEEETQEDSELYMDYVDAMIELSEKEGRC